MTITYTSDEIRRLILDDMDSSVDGMNEIGLEDVYFEVDGEVAIHIVKINVEATIL